MQTRECPACKGTGRVPGFENRDRLFRREFDRFTVRCRPCDGSGRVDVPEVFPPCAVCLKPGIGMSALCQEHQPKAPEWNPRWGVEIKSPEGR
jgi:RecJ-like exonuclease